MSDELEIALQRARSAEKMFADAQVTMERQQVRLDGYRTIGGDCLECLLRRASALEDENRMLRERTWDLREKLKKARARRKAKR